MIDRQALLSDLKPILKQLEDDLRERAKKDSDADTRFRAEWQKAKDAKRTAQAFEVFRDDQLTQIAVAWILSAVFVRFLEDNEFVDSPLLSGPVEPVNRLQLARDRHTLYFRKEPRHSDVHYLRSVFTEVGALPGLRALFDDRHNALWQLDPSADGATLLLGFFQKLDAAGKLIHDFTDKALETRFLGDLYQDLSERARKQYALLQTPEFVEEFILNRTLEPAIEEFGVDKVRLIDPACGSGHFLIGAFHRLLPKLEGDDPSASIEVIVQRALDAVAGVDLNPFAVAIARFRLLVAALVACHIRRLKEARDFQIHLSAGDSLLHGPRTVASGARQEMLLGEDHLKHVYQTEDAPELGRILGARYHVVVGNPPYITPKDPALNKEYRERYHSCHMKYSLGVPFTERFFDLARAGNERGEGAGYIGMITTNSFMKREFGKKLIEHPAYLRNWDMTHVIDTSGAYIPGHGTPTVILCARNRRPLSSEAPVRMVLGIRGEPATPEDPAKGLVWSAIMDQIDRNGSTSAFISVSDVPRERLAKHPWAIGGGGAAELKEELDEASEKKLADIAEVIGIAAVTGEDDAYLLPDMEAVLRHRLETVRSLIVGDSIREWCIHKAPLAVWVYDESYHLQRLEKCRHISHYLWPSRPVLSHRRRFGTPMLKRGLSWYEWQELYVDKLRAALSISFAFVATHNHFALDRGGRTFNRSAPVIKLPVETSEDQYLEILGVLNSSLSCFWLKQGCQAKAGSGIDRGIQPERWMERYEFSATSLENYPLPTRMPTVLAAQIDKLGSEIETMIQRVFMQIPTSESIARIAAERVAHIEEMIFLQEELDWECYALYDIEQASLTYSCPDSVRLHLGERAFEIALARKMAAGEVETTWFERHGSTPITEPPIHWPTDYRALVERRLMAIENNASIHLIEQPEYKRRWNLPAWENQLHEALRGWLLRRMEDVRYWPQPQVTSAARFSDRLRDDHEFLQVAEIYRGRADFDLTKLVGELALDEGMPFLAAFRYADAGRRKLTIWEDAWDLQRKEDAGQTVGDIPVPPKYSSADFQKQSYWRLRGKLDRPKETFILYPGAEREADPTPAFGWAGWDHKQQAEALVLYFQEMQSKEGWTSERLAPLLVGLLELLPWLKQWHNEKGPGGRGIADDYEQFLIDEARGLGLGLDDLKAWQPAKKTGRGRGRKS